MPKSSRFGKERGYKMTIVFFGFLIIFAFLAISSSLDKISKNQHRYEFISINERNLIIFDKKTGSYWQKVVDSNDEATEWQEQDSPITTQEKR